MANTFLTIGKIAQQALATLYEQTLMAKMVHRDFDREFEATKGDTITIRKPATFVANRFDEVAGIVLQDATETSTSVTMDRILDVSFKITQKDLTQKIEDFGAQLLAPAMMAIVQQIDMDLLAAAVSTGVTNATGTEGVPATDPTVLIDAAKLLNDAKVPTSGRFTVLTSTVGANFAKNALFLNADQRGDTEGVREASIGRKLGFENYVSTNFPTGAIAPGVLPGGLQVAATAVGDSVALHPHAIAFVTRSLAKPLGLSSEHVSVQSMDGLGLRATMTYNQTLKADIVSIDILYGVKLLDANKIVRIRG